jgi:5,10-methylenetetrahydrofolate reductase
MIVHSDRMRANLDATHGALYSQRALLALVERDRARDEAYRIVQEAAQRAWDTGTPFRELLAEAAPELDLDAFFDPSAFIRHADEIVGRLDAADVHEAFVPAGDADEPGQFPDAASLLRALQGRHFTELGITGYPESHHFINDETTISAMFEKEPMATYIVSQICFDPATIAWWVGAVRERGTMLPIWIGVPGIVHYGKLLRISMKIGLGESARFLRGHRSWLRPLMTRTFSPDPLMRKLEPLFNDPAANVAGLHVFTFNELEPTERWRQGLKVPL